jgi:hypothetical protein
VLLPFAGEETRVVFRRAFGGSGDTAAYKALTTTPAVVASVPPPAAKPPLESTLSATTGERRPEATTPAIKRAAPVIAGVALVAQLVGGYSLSASRSSNTVATGSSPIAASADASGPGNAASALAHAPETADAGALALVLVQNGAVASPLVAAQT